MVISNKHIVISMLLLLGIPAFSQKLKTDGRLTIRLRAGGNAATVIDKAKTPSQVSFAADGTTSKAKESNSFVTLGANYDFGKGQVRFSPGLWFTGTNLSLYNRDGINNEYSGTSKYVVSYLQIPLLIKYQSEKEIAKNLTWYISGGPQIGLRLKEGLAKGTGDYAHFLNMANYDTHNDSWRGRNGNGGPTYLFNPLYISLMINGGVDYKINDKIAVFGGLSLDFGITNAFNPNLMFYNSNNPRVAPYYTNPSEISITDYLKIRHNLIGLDFGVRF